MHTRIGPKPELASNTSGSDKQEGDTSKEQLADLSAADFCRKQGLGARVVNKETAYINLLMESDLVPFLGKFTG